VNGKRVKGRTLTFVFDDFFTGALATDAHLAAGVDGAAVGEELAEVGRGDEGEPVTAGEVFALLQAVLLGCRSRGGQHHT